MCIKIEFTEEQMNSIVFDYIDNKLSYKKIDTTQLKKIKWVNENIKPVDVLVVDKRNNKIIKECLVDHTE
jgi:hypothetical protein